MKMKIYCFGLSFHGDKKTPITNYQTHTVSESQEIPKKLGLKKM